MQAILLIGVDQALLATRAAVLRRTGCTTVCASIAGALATQEEQRAALVVLCHTVPEAAKIALARVIRERWPETRVLVVMARGGERAPGIDVCCGDGASSTHPDRLLHVAARLLDAHRPLPLPVGSRHPVAYIS